MVDFDIQSNLTDSFSNFPSYEPTLIPTPNGELGQDWWYYVSAPFWLWGIPSSTIETTQLFYVSNYSFHFVIADQLTDSHHDLSEINLYIQLYSPNKLELFLREQESDLNFREILRFSKSFHNLDDHIDNLLGSFKDYRSDEQTIEIQDDTISTKLSQLGLVWVRVWAESEHAANKVETVLKSISMNPALVIEPMHEKGVREIQSASLYSNVTVHPTHLPPPRPLAPPLSLDGSPGAVQFPIEFPSPTLILSLSSLLSPLSSLLSPLSSLLSPLSSLLSSLSSLLLVRIVWVILGTVLLFTLGLGIGGAAKRGLRGNTKRERRRDELSASDYLPQYTPLSLSDPSSSHSHSSIELSTSQISSISDPEINKEEIETERDEKTLQTRETFKNRLLKIISSPS